MTDQTYEDRDDEGGAEEGARGPTEREEEGKPYTDTPGDADGGDGPSEANRSS
jgi:hypothetical protein